MPKAKLSLIEAPVVEHTYIRPIRSIYYADFRGNQIIKVNRGLHARTAVPRAVDHMQINRYEAVLVEVFDDRDGVLHAVIKRSVDGNLTILFQRAVTEEM